MLKPTVCNRELCCWSFQELGVASGATDFVATSKEVVDMLLLLAKEAAKSPRREAILNPYPLVFDPADKTNKIFDPEHKDFARVENILSRIPTMDTLGETQLADKMTKISPYAYPLLNWVISSNRSFFMKVPSELEIPQIKCDQFIMLSSPPDRENEFRTLRKRY